MPYSSQWVEPEVALEYKGNVLYHIYKDDDVEQGERVHTFGLCTQGSDDSMEHAVYVCDLPEWTESPHPPYMGTDGDNSAKNARAWQQYRAHDIEKVHIFTVLREAIDNGTIKPLDEACEDGHY